MKPPRCELGEHLSLSWDGLSKHDVEGADAVTRDHQKTLVADLVDVTHLALAKQGQRKLARTGTSRTQTRTSGADTEGRDSFSSRVSVGSTCPSRKRSTCSGSCPDERARVGECAELVLAHVESVVGQDPLQQVRVSARLEFGGGCERVSPDSLVELLTVATA